MNMPYHPTADKLISELSQPSAGQNLGQLLFDTGKLTAAGIERVLQLQKSENLRFGEAAIKLGLITATDLRHALARQFAYPYLTPSQGHFSRELIAAYQPFGAHVEQFRALRSQIVLRRLSGEPQRKAIAITAPARGDGRSFIAANLAVVFSQLGVRTLLIDADMRNPRQHEIFKLENSAGLSNILSGRVGLDVITPIAGLSDLSVLSAGTRPPNPQELIWRPQFAFLLKTVATSHDVIILDTPAASLSSDAQMLAARAGTALIVARNNSSRAKDAQALTASLMQTGTHIIGSVLNTY